MPAKPGTGGLDARSCSEVGMRAGIRMVRGSKPRSGISLRERGGLGFFLKRRSGTAFRLSRIGRCRYNEKRNGDHFPRKRRENDWSVAGRGRQSSPSRPFLHMPAMRKGIR